MRARALLLLAAAALAPRRAAAWWAVGHLSVAEVAQRRLTPAAATAVARLLARDADAYPYESTLPAAADWLDLVKGSTDAFSVWHYADAPLALSPADSVSPSAAWSDAASAALVSAGGGAPNVVWALSRCFATLAPGSGADAPTRALLLRAALHLMGDLHQPCHCAAMTLPSGAMDNGANSVALKPSVPLGGGSSAANLHAWWDALGGDAVRVPASFPPEPRGSAGVPAAALAAYVDSLADEAAAADAALARSAPITAAALTDRAGALLRSWHAEGVALGASGVYGAAPVADALRAAAAAASRSVAVNTSHPAWPSYAAATQSAARARVALGGARLAAALNALLTYEVEEVQPRGTTQPAGAACAAAAPPPPPVAAPKPCRGAGGAIAAAVLGWLAAAAGAAALVWRLRVERAAGAYGAASAREEEADALVELLPAPPPLRASA
jgi:hypothetical protein